MKKWVFGLMGLLVIALIASGCAGKQEKPSPTPTPSPAPEKKVIGTYVWDLDHQYYIKLQQDGKFSFKGYDKVYSGTWEVKNSGSIILHFPEKSADFITRNAFDWDGAIMEKGLGMEPSLGSLLLGTSVPGLAFFDKK